MEMSGQSHALAISYAINNLDMNNSETIKV